MASLLQTLIILILVILLAVAGYQKLQTVLTQTVTKTVNHIENVRL